MSEQRTRPLRCPLAPRSGPVAFQCEWPACHCDEKPEGLYAQLAPEQRKTVLDYTGPDHLGTKPLETELFDAASALLADVRSRHPGEEFRCPHMRRLSAVVGEMESLRRHIDCAKRRLQERLTAAEQELRAEIAEARSKTQGMTWEQVMELSERISIDGFDEKLEGIIVTHGNERSVMKVTYPTLKKAVREYRDHQITAAELVKLIQAHARDQVQLVVEKTEKASRERT